MLYKVGDIPAARAALLVARCRIILERFTRSIRPAADSFNALTITLSATVVPAFKKMGEALERFARTYKRARQARRYLYLNRWPR